jgi:hypothetical protein
MTDVQEALDRLVPEPARAPAWGAVLRDARPRGRSLGLQLAVATGVAAVAALFVVAPWQGSERVGILDRALAAAGDGPVLHVVFRGGWGGTLVDLKTGERKPIYGEREVWYDPSRDLVHYVSRFGGVVQNEQQFHRKSADRELKALWQQYRTALETGTARIVGEDVVGGVPVYWVIVSRLMLPDVEDHQLHELAQQVAISQKTYEPVAMKYTRDRKTDPRGLEHILRYETVSVGEADFTSPPEASLESEALSMGSKPLALERAREILRRDPFWLGERFAGLPLVQTEMAVSATGQQQRTLVTGKRADEMRRCALLRADDSLRRTCRKRFSRMQIINDTVYEVGRVRFGPEHRGVTFFYGAVGDNPTTFKKGDLVPLWSEPHVVLTETTDPELITRGPGQKYKPPAGSVLLMPGASGSLIRDGVYVTIVATNEKLVLGAARVLEPMRE